MTATTAAGALIVLDDFPQRVANLFEIGLVSPQKKLGRLRVIHYRCQWLIEFVSKGGCQFTQSRRARKVGQLIAQRQKDSAALLFLSSA